MNKALFNLPVLTCAVLSIAATAVISVWVFAERPEPPTALLDEPYPAPDFVVTDHTGQTLSRGDLLGRVWVCDFFLTRCNGICPILGFAMSDLADELSQDTALDEVQLISFSVDPEYDTLEELQRYRKTNLGAWDRGSDERRTLLEARWAHTRADDQQAFWALVKEGFKLHVGPANNDPTTPVAHSGRLVLIDQQGQIRGYYDGLTDRDKPALFADIRRLIASPD